MFFKIDDEEYEVIINKKSNKKTYIRVKEDLKIYVSTSFFSTKNSILKLLNENKEELKKLIELTKSKIEKNEYFFYLGNKYDIIEVPTLDDIEFTSDIIYVKNKHMLNKWYKSEIERIFDERFIYNFNRFEEEIKCPILKTRTMKTRWGVYNRSNHSITLNTKLIEYDLDKIDYVIIHELSHIIHFDHSANFWQLVSKYCPNYKKIRKEMKE